jgi:type IV pilus assembly protein PilE
MSATKTRGVTLAELLTVLVVVTVLTAVAVPLWRVHLLRVRREDAMAALLALQAAQDRYFGKFARYASAAQLTRAAPDGLGLKALSEHGYYHIELRSSDDGLGYSARARATRGTGQADDTRCIEFTLDHNNRRRATDNEGNDRSADCWR